MASSHSGSWLAIAAGAIVVGLVLGVLWIAGEDDNQPTPRSDPFTGTKDPDPPELPELDPGAETSSGAVTMDLAGDSRVDPEDLPDEIPDDVVLIMGWVEDMSETRMPDVDVNLFDDVGEYLDTTTTDENGDFSFAWEEPLDRGWSLGTEPEPLFDWAGSNPVVPAHYVHRAALMPGDPPVECKLVLAAAPRIQGHVIDAETRAPIELADVEAVSTAPAWVDEYVDAFTEEDGTFELALVDIPAHGVLVRVMDDEDRFAILGPFDLAPAEVRYVEVALSDSPVLEGVVTDGTNNEPVEGAEVSLLPMHDAFDSGEAWDITADDGSWLLDPVDVPSDQIWVFVEADELGPALLHPTGTDQPLDIRLGPPVELRGALTEKDTGEPVSDATIRVVLRGPSGLIEDYEDFEFSEDDGTFSLLLESVPPEAAEVFIESDEHARFRADLADLAPTHLGLRQYDVNIEMRRIPGY